MTHVSSSGSFFGFKGFSDRDFRAATGGKETILKNQILKKKGGGQGRSLEEIDRKECPPKN
jgi:hypothetical protein